MLLHVTTLYHMEYHTVHATLYHMLLHVTSCYHTVPHLPHGVPYCTCHTVPHCTTWSSINAPNPLPHPYSTTLYSHALPSDGILYNITTCSTTRITCGIKPLKQSRGLPCHLSGSQIACLKYPPLPYDHHSLTVYSLCDLTPVTCIQAQLALCPPSNVPADQCLYHNTYLSFPCAAYTQRRACVQTSLFLA